MLVPAEDGGASLDARGVCPVVHSESAKPVASGAIKLKLDICKACASLRRAPELAQIVKYSEQVRDAND